MFESFSEYYWRSILSSDWFYPSNIDGEPRAIEDKGSIDKTLSNQDLELFSGTEKTSKIFYGTIVLRCLARQVAFIVIGILCAPLGIAYHGFYIVHNALSLKKKKTMRHEMSILTDAMIAGISLVLVYSIFQSYRLTQHKKQQFVHLSRVISILPFFVYISWDPKRSAKLFSTFDSDAQVGFYKSLILKNDFGIVSRSNKLLSYSHIGNKEWRVEERYQRPLGPSRLVFSPEGTFSTIHFACFLKAIEKLEELIYEFNEIKIPYPPTEDKIKDLVTLLIKEYPNEEYSLNDWLRSYMRILITLRKITKHEEFAALESLDKGYHKAITEYVKPFYFSEADFHQRLKEYKSQIKKRWSDYQRNAVESLGSIPRNLDMKLQFFYLQICQCGDDPRYLFPPEGSGMFVKQLMRRAHPDKNPGEHQKFYEEFTKIIVAAHRLSKKVRPSGDITKAYQEGFQGLRSDQNNKIAYLFCCLLEKYFYLDVPYPPIESNIEEMISQLQKKYPSDTQFLKQWFKRYKQALLKLNGLVAYQKTFHPTVSADLQKFSSHASFNFEFYKKRTEISERLKNCQREALRSLHPIPGGLPDELNIIIMHLLRSKGEDPSFLFYCSETKTLQGGYDKYNRIMVFLLSQYPNSDFLKSLWGYLHTAWEQTQTMAPQTTVDVQKYDQMRNELIETFNIQTSDPIPRSTYSILVSSISWTLSLKSSLISLHGHDLKKKKTEPSIGFFAPIYIPRIISHSITHLNFHSYIDCVPGNNEFYVFGRCQEGFFSYSIEFTTNSEAILFCHCAPTCGLQLCDDSSVNHTLWPGESLKQTIRSDKLSYDF